MPSGYLTNKKGLQTSTELLLSRGRSFLFGNTWFLISPKSSTNNFTRAFHTGDRRTPPLTFVEKFSRTPSVHNSGFFQRTIMAACTHLLGQPQLRAARKFHGSVMGSSSIGIYVRSDVRYGNKGVDLCKTSNSKTRSPWSSNIFCRSFWTNASSKSWIANISNKQGAENFQSPYSLSCYSTGAVPEVSFDGASRDEQCSKLEGSCSLKLHSASCYLPHPEKEATGGEDAHFICEYEQAIGVADGVGGWAELGINAGNYARELMSNSVSAIKEEPKGFLDPSRVLHKAYDITKSRGSSTACIIALTQQGLHAVNLGDSGFIVVREGCTVFRSPVQQHDFNFTFQLESGNGSDLPSSAQVFNVAVESGDVIVAGTDGLFDNLYNNEVTAVVVHATRAGLGPEVTAEKIAALARQRALDKNRQTPFSSAAQEAGYRYYGGKLDDITVVVSYITASGVKL